MKRLEISTCSSQPHRRQMSQRKQGVRSTAICRPVSGRIHMEIAVYSVRVFQSLEGLEVIKLFSSSAQLSMKFQLLINVEIIKISGKFRFTTRELVIYSAHKC